MVVTRSECIVLAASIDHGKIGAAVFSRAVFRTCHKRVEAFLLHGEFTLSEDRLGGFTGRANDLSVDEDFDLARIKGAAHLLLDAMELMRCRNIYLKSNSAPKRLNRKRVCRGKRPFFEYKTLHMSAASRGIYKGEPPAEKTRNSPRVHFRRGHVRRISDDHLVWVAHCVVGDKKQGIIVKDYAVGATA